MKQFQHVGKAFVPRSMFNLSYEKKFTCDMGQLIPVMCDEVVPGDIVSLGNQLLIRMQPMTAPIMHEINAYVHYFFVPYRILWTDWELFITGGVDGPQVPDVSPVLPRWNPASNAKGTLWDYMGMPVGVTPDADNRPLLFPQTAYYTICNEYYRDENLMTKIALPNATLSDIRYRCWEKDYFTSSLPWFQRGIAPAMPISGTTSAVWAGAVTGTIGFPAVSAANSTPLVTNSANFAPFNAHTKSSLETGIPSIPKAGLDANTVNLASATTFNVRDLRLAFQIQKWMERNARAGIRYTEFLNAHFGVNPRDDRLQRPEYIGGTKTPLIISEVLQTSEDGTTPQGNLAGHGITADMRAVGKYHVQEYGVIMGIMSIMPKPLYQQGIDRQWLRKTKYDFYFPEFANLSEQAIERNEIFSSAVKAENETIFGYQGRYDEMRVKRNMVCGEFRDTLDYWHISRQFAAAPTLNNTFVLMSGISPRKDFFAVPEDPGFLVNCGNLIKAIRPMPIMSNPGLIDH